MHDDGHETGPRTYSVDAPRETGKTVSLGPGKGDIVLVCDVQRIGLRHTTTRIIINRSSATAEKQWKQCISYASLSRLANWGQNYYIISGLGGTCPLCLPPSMDPSLPGDGHISVWYTCIYVWYICVTVSGTHVSVWYTCDSVWYTCASYLWFLYIRRYLEMDISLPSDAVHKFADQLSTHLQCSVGEVRRLFLVEDMVDTLKVCCERGCHFCLI